MKQIRKKTALKCNHATTRGFQKTQVGSNERKICGDGLESHKDWRSRWVSVGFTSHTLKEIWPKWLAEHHSRTRGYKKAKLRGNLMESEVLVAQNY